MFHHLAPDAEFTIGLEDNKSKYIGVFLLLVVLKTDRVGTYDNVIVVGKSGELSVLGCYFHVETGGVLNREGIKVKFPENVNILIIDLSNCDR